MKENTNLDNIFEIAEKLKEVEAEFKNIDESFRARQAEETKIFEDEQARNREMFLDDQKKAREEFWKEQYSLRRKIIGHYDDMLNEGEFIRLGDLKVELMNYFEIDESEIVIELIPTYSLNGWLRSHEMIAKVEEEKTWNAVSFGLEIPSKDINWLIEYETDLNMLQADGVSFIRHCYSSPSTIPYNGQDIHSTYVCVLPECLDDMLVKVPYRALVLEDDSLGKDAFWDFGSNDFVYWNKPIDVFTHCVVNCIEKARKRGPILAKFPPKDNHTGE